MVSRTGSPRAECAQLGAAHRGRRPALPLLTREWRAALSTGSATVQATGSEAGRHIATCEHLRQDPLCCQFSELSQRLIRSSVQVRSHDIYHEALYARLTCAMYVRWKHTGVGTREGLGRPAMPTRTRYIPRLPLKRRQHDSSETCCGHCSSATAKAEPRRIGRGNDRRYLCGTRILRFFHAEERFVSRSSSVVVEK